MRMLTPTLALMTLLVAGCASGGGGGDPYAPITAQELLASGAGDLEAAVRSLRPRWLTAGRESVSTSARGIEVCRGSLIVYQDGRRARRTLRELSVVGVVSVEFIRPGRTRPDGDRTCLTLAAVNVITPG